MTEAAAQPSPESGPVTFTLSGSARRVLAEGNWPSDNRLGWAAVQAAPRRKAGAGHQFLVTMSEGDATDLLEYLESVAAVTADMTSSERSGGTEGKAASRAARSLRRAMNLGD